MQSNTLETLDSPRKAIHLHRVSLAHLLAHRGRGGRRTLPRVKAEPSQTRHAKRLARAESSYLMCTPEIAREITRRWISAVPSKMS